MRDIERRVSRLEGLFLPPDNNEPVLIRIAGGLPGSDMRHASIGNLQVFAEPGESQADFEKRCLDEAALLSAPYVIVGGLPP